jgi:hypothetical protein
VRARMEHLTHDGIVHTFSDRVPHDVASVTSWLKR